MKKNPRDGLSAGHGEGSRHPGQSDSGANVIGDGLPAKTEDDYTLEMCQSVRADLRAVYSAAGQGFVMLRDSGLYSRADNDCALNDCDLFIEFHTDSLTATSTGVGTFYRTDRAQKLAAMLAKNGAHALGLRNRGARRNDTFAVLDVHPGMDSVLVEMFFGSNKSDTRAFLKHRDAFVLAMVNCILTWHGWNTVSKRPSQWTAAEKAAYKPI